jgi:hypothetical protein
MLRAMSASEQLGPNEQCGLDGEALPTRTTTGHLKRVRFVSAKTGDNDRVAWMAVLIPVLLVLFLRGVMVIDLVKHCFEYKDHQRPEEPNLTFNITRNKETCQSRSPKP